MPKKFRAKLLSGIISLKKLLSGHYFLEKTTFPSIISLKTTFRYHFPETYFQGIISLKPIFRYHFPETYFQGIISLKPIFRYHFPETYFPGIISLKPTSGYYFLESLFSGVFQLKKPTSSESLSPAKLFSGIFFPHARRIPPLKHVSAYGERWTKTTPVCVRHR